MFQSVQRVRVLQASIRILVGGTNRARMKQIPVTLKRKLLLLTVTINRKRVFGKTDFSRVNLVLYFLVFGM